MRLSKLQINLRLRSTFTIFAPNRGVLLQAEIKPLLPDADNAAEGMMKRVPEPVTPVNFIPVNIKKL